LDNQYIINPLSLHAILNFSFFFVTFRFVSFRSVSYWSDIGQPSRSQMWSRDCLTFRRTLAYSLYLVFKRLKHKSLLRCKTSHSYIFFFPFTVCDFVLLKFFLETARLNPRISTTEHVHALYFLSHIDCTVTINRVKKVPEKMSLHWLKAIL
jgi:hypothetical protein